MHVGRSLCAVMQIQGNKDKMKTAIVTLAVGDYLVGARDLFHSLAEYGLPDSVERVVIGVDSCDFAQAVPISVDYSMVSINKAIFAATANKFFSLTLPYDRVVMLDSDMLCIGDCSLLWSEHIKNLPFYACRDTAARFYYGDKIVRIGLDHMRILNSGMFVYNRNLYADLYADLLGQITAGVVESYDGGDQGYFNHFFQNNDIEIGWLPGGLNYCLDQNMPQLPEAERRLIHFTGVKPWRGSVLKSSPMFPYYEQWIKAEKSLSGEDVVESITDAPAESLAGAAATGNFAKLWPPMVRSNQNRSRN